jgi:hypothetical protein
MAEEETPAKKAALAAKRRELKGTALQRAMVSNKKLLEDTLEGLKDIEEGRYQRVTRK